MKIRERIFPALDVDTLSEAQELVENLWPYVGSFKVGLQLLHSEGSPNVISTLLNIGGKVFADTKLHDIPNTVGQAAKAVSGHGASFFNLMAEGGIDMMMAADDNKGDAKVLAVTVLTSREENEAHLSLGGPTKAKVLQYAREAILAGLDGFVCSPLEVELLQSRRELVKLRKMAGLDEPIYVTPGIRPAGVATHDQKRTNTPYAAILAGATHLVIGRAITQAEDPVKAVESILEEVRLGLLHRLLLLLFENEHIKFGAFKLKLHEKNPDAPLSPIYINLREMNEGIIKRIAELLYDMAEREGLEYDYAIGIPKAGIPIAEAFCKLAEVPQLYMEKDESEEKRRITSRITGEFEKGKRVLLIDDLITKADTKLEAIAGVKENGLIAEDLLVTFDREQGGKESMEKAGKRLHALIGLSESLDFYVQQNKITEGKRSDVIAYIKEN